MRISSLIIILIQAEMCTRFLEKVMVKKLRCDTDKDGYYRVSLQTTDNTRRSFRVNRLVALTYIDNPNGFPIVHHIDNNKKNNDVENLEWVSVSKKIQKKDTITTTTTIIKE